MSEKRGTCEQAFNSFCKDTYIENRKCSLTVSRAYADAIRAYLEKDYSHVAAFFNADSWNLIDTAKLANFKFYIKRKGLALRTMPIPPCLVNDSSTREADVLVQPRKVTRSKNAKTSIVVVPPKSDRPVVISSTPTVQTEDWSLVVCVEDFYKVIKWAHEDIGHGGETNTEKRLKGQFSHIPRSAVVQYLKMCPQCEVKRTGMKTRRRLAAAAYREQEDDNDPVDAADQTPKAWCASLLKTLYQQQQANLHCDVQLMTSEGTLLGGHACVLATASPTLSSLIYSGLESPVTLQTWLSHSVLKHVLRLVYTGEMEPDASEEMPHIKQACADLGLTVWPVLYEKEQPVVEDVAEYIKQERSMETSNTEEGEFGDSVYDGDVVGNADDDDDDMEESQTTSPQNEPSDPDRPFRCDVCCKRFRLKGTLTKHKVVHSDERPFECKVCSARFRRKDKLQEHADIHLEDRPLFECSICGASFCRRTLLREHQSIHTGEKPFKCEECGAMFRLRSMLNSHKVVHVTDETFKCGKCSKAFRSRQQLRSHELVHSENKPMKCGVCSLSFHSKAVFQQHVLIHSKPFECPTCSKGFARKYQLEAHLEGNTECVTDGTLQLVCQYCDKSFVFESSLRLHERQHVTTVVHKCQDCEETFATAAKLRVHVRMQHVEDSPLKCKMCGKVFPELNLLKRHTLSHKTISQTQTSLTSTVMADYPLD